MRKPSLSLRARAITLLAQREHSAMELRRKLLRIARERDKILHAEASSADSSAALDCASEAAAVAQDPGPEVAALLTWLQAQGYLDETRFVESRLHARLARHGNLRIKQELAQHGLSLAPEQAQALKDSELERARVIWQRKFGEPAQDPAARAKQMRFLAGRGFSADVIRQLLRSSDP
ncbi:MAG TPA: regulatory protein RecX [Burkholderiaceae bacterium]|jgi:regulatory protein